MEARENIVGQATETVANALIPQKNDKQKWWQQITEYSLIVIFVVMFLTMSLTVDHFFSIENMLGLALSISQIGMVACTMMFCLASRDFDLSVGSIVAFAGVLCAMVLNATGNTFIAIVAAVFAGAAIEALPEWQRQELIRAIVRREIGVMAVSAVVVALLGVRASGWF